MKKILKNIPYIVGIAAVIFVAAGLSSYLSREEPISENMQIAAVPFAEDPEWYYRFQSQGTLEESGRLKDSSSPFWWLDSGGRLLIKDGIGETLSGESEPGSKWAKAYSESNPADTDGGRHPQNIFRLLSKKKWLDATVEARFRITKVNVSESPNRNESNGLLLMSRYLDSNNLYYAGIRVDGHAVIKKKVNGVYYTLAEKKIFESEADYNRDVTPNVLPGGKWIGLRSDVKNDQSGVRVSLFVDKDGSGLWQEALSAIDDGRSYGGTAIREAGLFGIRTDFMDVQFDDFKIYKIEGLP